MTVIDFIMANQASFVALGAALLTAGGIVVKLTPTKADDAWWEALMRQLGRRQ